MSEERQPVPEPTPRRCAICDEVAFYGFGPPGGRSTDAWYCGPHRQEGERRWVARYGRPTNG